VTDDGSEVIVMGQHTGALTLTDATGSATTLRSRGSYEVFVAAYDAADGSGKWAVDGGGDGMEYFFAMSSDPVTHDVYVGGTTRSQYITWGDVKRKNAMHIDGVSNGPSSVQSISPVGSSKAFTVQLKSSTVLPSCLTGCSASFGKPQASDVKSGHCYIDRHCYAEGDFAPYPGEHCNTCDPSASAAAPMEWTGPDTTAHCVIDGVCLDDGAHKQVRSGRSMVDDLCMKCDVSSSTSAYTAVPGCLLDLSSFEEGSYFTNGSSMPASMQPAGMHSTISALQADKATLQDEKATLQADKATLQAEMQADKASLEKDKARLQADIAKLEKDIAELQDKPDKQDNDVPDWAIALVVVVGTMFVLVLVILFVLVSREQQGRPIFVPMSTKTLEKPSTTNGAFA